jgi:hypothetical protein
VVRSDTRYTCQRRSKSTGHPPKVYSPKCLEGVFSEVPLYRVLGSSLTSHRTDLHCALSTKPGDLLHDPAALSGEVALVIRIRPGMGHLVDEAAEGVYGPNLFPALRRKILQDPL